MKNRSEFQSPITHPLSNTYSNYYYTPAHSTPDLSLTSAADLPTNPSQKWHVPAGTTSSTSNDNNVSNTQS